MRQVAPRAALDGYELAGGGVAILQAAVRDSPPVDATAFLNDLDGVRRGPALLFQPIEGERAGIARDQVCAFLDLEILRPLLDLHVTIACRQTRASPFRRETVRS